MSRNITEAQAKLIFGHKPGKPESKKATTPRSAPRLAENAIEDQIVGFLRLHGWEVRRQQVGTYIPYFAAMQLTEGKPLNHTNVVKIGTKGMCDWIARRRTALGAGIVEVFEIEVKAPGREPDDHQVEYMRKQQALGYLAVWFSSFDRFKEWYVPRFRT